MKQELTDKLYRKYPKIFAQKDLPMTQTLMCWGIDCGDGWYNIIDVLCKQIQHHISYKQLPQVEAVQVKEKFGGLRFYTNHTNDYIQGAIEFAESISLVTCEVCGKPGKQYGPGWIETLCPEHAALRGKTEEPDDDF